MTSSVLPTVVRASMAACAALAFAKRERLPDRGMQPTGRGEAKGLLDQLEHLARARRDGREWDHSSAGRLGGARRRRPLPARGAERQVARAVVQSLDQWRAHVAAHTVERDIDSVGRRRGQRG